MVSQNEALNFLRRIGEKLPFRSRGQEYLPCFLDLLSQARKTAFIVCEDIDAELFTQEGAVELLERKLDQPQPVWIEIVHPHQESLLYPDEFQRLCHRFSDKLHFYSLKREMINTRFIIIDEISVVFQNLEGNNLKVSRRMNNQKVADHWAIQFRLLKELSKELLLPQTPADADAAQK